MKIIYDAGGGRNALDSSHVDCEGKIGIEVRGKTSQIMHHFRCEGASLIIESGYTQRLKRS